MFTVKQTTDDAFQRQIMYLPDGSFIDLTLLYRPQQYGWFIDQLLYQSFEIHGVRITNSPNMLHQFRNQLPFGLACFSTNDREPTQQQDFTSGASALYVLTAAEVKQYTEFLSGG